MPQPFGIVSDIHLHNWSAFSKILPSGENERLMIILHELEVAAEMMHQTGCKRMYIAGDLFHVRGKITPSVLNPTLEVFERITKTLEVRIIPGNHDLESDTSCELTNATQALASLGCDVVTKPTYYADDDVLMVPWEPDLGTLRRTLSEQHSEHEPTSAIIHAPLNNVIAGIPDHGLEADDLAKIGYQQVFVGHYHNRKDFNNGTWSIGALTHQTWGDVNTDAGYLIVKGDEVAQYTTSAPKFVDYDETQSDDQTRERCKGNYVRVKLGEASETEIQAIRELVKGELGAKEVVVHATPKRVTTERKASIKSGASLEASVHDYVSHSDTNVDKTELSRECTAILMEADTGEDD